MRALIAPNGAIVCSRCARTVVLPESGAGRLSARSSSRLRRTDPSAPAIGEARGHGLPIRAAIIHRRRVRRTERPSVGPTTLSN